MPDDPRPATASILPGASAAAVASCWKTRMGSSVESTVTVVDRMMSVVDAAAALMIEVGEDIGIPRVWCSPIPKTSSPTSSARWIASRRLRTAWAVGPWLPSSLRGVLPNE